MKTLKKLFTWIKASKYWLIITTAIISLLALIKVVRRKPKVEYVDTVSPTEAKDLRVEIDKVADSEHDRIAARNTADRERIRKAMERSKDD